MRAQKNRKFDGLRKDSINEIPWREEENKDRQ